LPKNLSEQFALELDSFLNIAPWGDRLPICPFEQGVALSRYTSLIFTIYCFDIFCDLWFFKLSRWYFQLSWFQNSSLYYF
jgi:hypothetical protein